MSASEGVSLMFYYRSWLLGVVLVTGAISWGCGASGPRTVSDAVRHGDVVVGPGGMVSNLPVWASFLNNINRHKQASVRITTFSTEGDPVFTDLSYNGQTIRYTFDDSQDRFAGQQRGRQTTTCTGVTTRSVKNGTLYLVTGCQNTNVPSDILFVPTSQR
jgi:hypothetical protein